MGITECKINMITTVDTRKVKVYVLKEDHLLVKLKLQVNNFQLWAT